MDYEFINIRTVINEGKALGGLSFVERGHDIPFEIKRMYFIYVNEQHLQIGFQPYNRSQQLPFCPNGKIDVIIDNASSKITFSLDTPSKGLILYQDIWREIVWNTKDGILCVATSGNYDTDAYKRDYDLFLRYMAEKNTGMSQLTERKRKDIL